ncbi:MAG: phage terminase large subunit [Bryobacteraceae bacterium]
MPSQKAFHECGARFKGFSGPVGSGKSQALCQEAIRLAYQNPGRMGLLGAPTYSMLRDATQTALFEILGETEIPYEHNKSESIVILRDSKSKILFRSMDDYERLRGTNLAWFGLDELTYTAEEAWNRMESRLRDPKAPRLCGFAAWTPKGYDWVYRRFICDETKVRGHVAILAQPNENKHLLAQVPDYYERLKDSYDERFFAQEAKGEYLSLDGSRVYGAFDRKVHVQALGVDPNVPLLWALDFNVDPMSSIVAQYNGGIFRVLDEIVIRHATTPEAVEAFTKRYPAHGMGVTVYGDASGNNSKTSGSTDYQMVRDCFTAKGISRVNYRVPPSNPSVRDRITLTNGRLKSASGNIAMLVDPKCKELIQDFEQVSYKIGSTQVDKERDRMRTHASDAVGYLLWQECPIGPKIGCRQERLL